VTTPRPKHTDALITELAQLKRVFAEAMETSDDPAVQAAQARPAEVLAEVERRAEDGDPVAAHALVQRRRRALQQQLADHRHQHPGAFAARARLRQRVAVAIKAEAEALRVVRENPYPAEQPPGCDRMCMAPFGSHHERCVLPTDHDGGREGCNHAEGHCSDVPSELGSR